MSSTHHRSPSVDWRTLLAAAATAVIERTASAVVDEDKTGGPERIAGGGEAVTVVIVSEKAVKIDYYAVNQLNNENQRCRASTSEERTAEMNRRKGGER